MSKTETTYNVVLGTKDDGTIVILERTFQHSDSFHGATGAALRPVTQAEIDAALTADEKTEWYEELWRNEVKTRNGETLGLTEWVDTIDDDEYIESRFDEYQDIDADTIAETLGLPEAPARYTLIGCGRIFPEALLGLTALETDEVAQAILTIEDYEHGR